MNNIESTRTSHRTQRELERNKTTPTAYISTLSQWANKILESEQVVEVEYRPYVGFIDRLLGNGGKSE